MGGSGSGRGGLSPFTVLEAERLFKAGWTRVRVANRLKIGLTTAKRIELGEHFLQLTMDELSHHRCPGCGALIETQTCLLCELRAAGL